MVRSADSDAPGGGKEGSKMKRIILLFHGRGNWCAPVSPGKRCITCVARLLMLLALPAVVQAQDYTYTTNNGTITITKYIGTNNVVVIPDMIGGLLVTSIRTNAFDDCISPASIMIGTNITSIGARAFASCYSLTNITVESANTSYSTVEGVLFNKDQTMLIQYPHLKGESYTIPSSVASIGYWSFVGCGLTNLMIPDSVTCIESVAFGACRGLRNVTIPDSVTNIGDLAFNWCTNLASVKIGTCIGRGMFFFCYRLDNVTISSNVTSIGDGAFYNCTSLSNVVIPDSVTNIGDMAFYECFSLAGVTIGSSVVSIGDGAFHYCTSLTGITVNVLNASYSSSDGILFDKSRTVLIQCPGSKIGNYTIPNSVTNIGGYAFFLCTNLTSVTIPNSVTNIGELAFSHCRSLTSVTIGSTLASIHHLAFESCPNLIAACFRGNAPEIFHDMVASPIDLLAYSSTYNELFYNSDNVTIYYLPDTTGWEPTFEGRPTVLWNPLIAPSEPGFGMGTNNFGFNISGPANIPIVVQACTNLESAVWVPLLTTNLDTGSFYFNDPEWTNYPARFYNLRMP